MTPEQFRAACQILWGDERVWRPAMTAEKLDVNVRNVFYWANGDKEVPPGVAEELLGLLRTAWYSETTSPHLSVLRLAIDAPAEGTKAA